MNLKEQLKMKKAELAALKSKIAAGDTEAIKAGEEIAEAIKNIEEAIKSAEAMSKKKGAHFSACRHCQHSGCAGDRRRMYFAYGGDLFLCVQ